MTRLRQIEYLVAMADHGHFGHAAQAVNIFQPTLSQQLKTLEQCLGVILVERATTDPSLTPIGPDLVARAPSWH